MDSTELLKSGDPCAALAALTEEVRAAPAQSRHRVFMAQLLCVLGQWTRAQNQLSVAAELDALAVPMKQVYSDAIRCEALRAEVFAGRRAPMVFGQPDEWLALLIESLLRQGKGEGDSAVCEDLRQRAFEAAPARAGDIDGQRFEWLADADMRLGPVLEAFINGRYYWVPFERLASIDFDPPEDLRDVVWLPALLNFVNGGETLALVPTRYDATHQCDDGQLLLARKTEWRELRPEVWAGFGQRVLGSDIGEHAMLDVRRVVFNTAAADAENGAATPGSADG